MDKLPGEFRDALRNIEIAVEDWPDPRLMEELFGDRDEVVYGVFVGTPLPEQSYDAPVQLPALIRIYRGPLEEDFDDPEELSEEIEITLVHEIAHYLGFDEDKLEEYGYD